MLTDKFAVVLSKDTEPLVHLMLCVFLILFGPMLKVSEEPGEEVKTPRQPPRGSWVDGEKKRSLFSAIQ